jgi:hypothetical protein
MFELQGQRRDRPLHEETGRDHPRGRKLLCFDMHALPSGVRNPDQDTGRPSDQDRREPGSCHQYGEDLFQGTGERSQSIRPVPAAETTVRHRLRRNGESLLGESGRRHDKNTWSPPGRMEKKLPSSHASSCRRPDVHSFPSFLQNIRLHRSTRINPSTTATAGAPGNRATASPGYRS